MASTRWGRRAYGIDDRGEWSASIGSCRHSASTDERGEGSATTGSGRHMA